MVRAYPVFLYGGAARGGGGSCCLPWEGRQPRSGCLGTARGGVIRALMRPRQLVTDRGTTHGGDWPGAAGIFVTTSVSRLHVRPRWAHVDARTLPTPYPRAHARGSSWWWWWWAGFAAA